MGMPSLGKKVFIASINSRNNATFASPFFNSRYWEYGMAYKVAGDRLVDKAIEDASLFLCVSIYPISFLYRQFLELYIKQLLILFDANFKNDYKLNGSHDLGKLWICLKALISNNLAIFQQNIDWKSIQEILDATTQYITELSQLDCGSMSFRYPDDKSHNSYYFQHESKIDLVNLRDRITELADFLCVSEETLWYIKTLEDEMQQNYHY